LSNYGTVSAARSPLATLVYVLTSERRCRLVRTWVQARATPAASFLSGVAPAAQQDHGAWEQKIRPAPACQRGRARGLGLGRLLQRDEQLQRARNV